MHESCWRCFPYSLQNVPFTGQLLYHWLVHWVAKVSWVQLTWSLNQTRITSLASLRHWDRIADDVIKNSYSVIHPLVKKGKLHLVANGELLPVFIARSVVVFFLTQNGDYARLAVPKKAIEKKQQIIVFCVFSPINTIICCSSLNAVFFAERRCYLCRRTFSKK